MTTPVTRSPDGTFTLFVVLPNESVCTLRGLASGICVRDVKGKLELSAGLPSQIYMLTYPDGECLSDKERLLVQENVRDGYLLRVHIHENWDTIYHSVLYNNVEHVHNCGGVYVKDNVLLDQDETGKVNTMVRERATAALFIAAYLGLGKMCQMLISVGTNLNGSTTFGRTALHAAASQDNISMVNILLDAGALTHVCDVFGQSPADTARSYESYQCEKRLRLMMLNLSGTKRLQDEVCNTEESIKKPFRKIRVSSVPQKQSVKDMQLKYKRPNTSSAGASRKPFIFFNAKSFESTHNFKGYLSGKVNERTAIQSNPKHDGYWVISQTKKTNEIDSGLERRYINFLDNHDSLIQSKQYPFPASKFRILKFRKDNTQLKVQNQQKTLEDEHLKSAVLTQTTNMGGIVPRTTANSTNNIDEVMSATDMNMHSTTNANEDMKTNKKGKSDCAKGSEIDINVKTDDDNENMILKSSMKSSDQQPRKRVRFSAKDRCVKNLMKPETKETFKQIKRKLEIAANRSDNGNSKSDTKHSGISYERWLQRKRIMELRLKQEESSSSEDDDDEGGDSAAFTEWLKKKKEANYGPPRPVTRPIPGLIQIGSTDAGDGRNPDPVTNVRAYREWVDKRNRTKRIPNFERMRTMEDFMTHKKKLEEKRQQLLIHAVSYDEWMDDAMERKSMIRRILCADFEKLKEIENQKLFNRAPHQISYDRWKEMAKKREEEETKRREAQQKLNEENERYKRELLRSSAAIPHTEWLKLKRSQESLSSHKENISPRPESQYGSMNTRQEAEHAYEKWIKKKHEEELSDLRSKLYAEQQLMNTVRYRTISPLVTCQ